MSNYDHSELIFYITDIIPVMQRTHSIQAHTPSRLCAPGTYDSKHKTCFKLNHLVELAGAYNRYMTKNKLIPTSRTQTGQGETAIDTVFIKIREDKDYLLACFRERFMSVCGSDESCWLKQAFMNEIVGEMREEISKGTFRHEGPAKANEWLSTLDIENIMKQYESVYPHFKFYGAVPLDCDELSYCQLSQLDFERDQHRGIEQIGIVYNHDRHNGAGSHWVALYVDMPKSEINYCDSTGRKPFDNMASLIERFKAYCQKCGKTAVIALNTAKYQTDDSECGVYSCNFIIRRLAGESFSNVVDNPLAFKDINSCRNVYFSNGPSSYEPHRMCDPRL